MKQARVRGYKKVRQPVQAGRAVPRLVRRALGWLITCLPLLPILALVLIFLLPETPHLRVSYTYRGSHEHPRYLFCKYLGIYGMVETGFGQDCPLVAFIETKPEP